jgi:hypothetical protein
MSLREIKKRRRECGIAASVWERTNAHIDMACLARYTISLCAYAYKQHPFCSFPFAAFLFILGTFLRTSATCLCAGCASFP